MGKNKKIKLTIGIPASGKSTWKKKFLRDNPNYVSVCRDDFRYMLRDSGFLDPKGEKLVTEMVEKAITEAIKSKYNVIVDQTNVSRKYLLQLISFCEKLGDVEFQIFDIPLDVAIERDKNRERSVGVEVIARMHVNYLTLFDCNFDFSMRKKKPYISQDVGWLRNSGLEDAIIFDIDGTIAHMQGKRGTFDWGKVDRDEVDHRMKIMMNSFFYQGMKVILITGRDGISYNLTKEWLDFNNFKYHHLYTKPENDFRKDTITKTEIFNNHIKDKYNVYCAFDDRDQAVKMWRGLGIKCYQVADGTF